MASYQEEIAKWRVQRQQQQIANRVEEIRQEHAQIARERDQAMANNDLETAEFRDMDCEQLENEWRQYVPPPNPLSQHDVAYLQQKKAFLERNGELGRQLIARAHRQAVMPRNPNASSQTDPNTYGMGLRRGTGAYYKAMDNLLEMYAKEFGAHYDPNEDQLNWQEAARSSGLSQQGYANAYKALKAQGRVS
jgi:hypothetical protein